MKIDQLRCIHRHTIKEHPACFSKGLVNWPDEKTFSSITKEPWYHFPGYRIGYFDIEVDNLNADFGTLLTWCIKEKDGDVLSDYITKDEIFSGEFDKRITQSFIDALQTFSIIIGYYSDRFDMPYMRAKALHYGLEFPGYGDIYHWDLYYTVRNKLKLSRNSLDNACSYLGIVGKTPIDKQIWREAKYGDQKAISEVLRHNVADVEITEALHNKLDFIRKWTKRSI